MLEGELRQFALFLVWICSLAFLSFFSHKKRTRSVGLLELSCFTFCLKASFILSLSKMNPSRYFFFFLFLSFSFSFLFFFFFLFLFLFLFLFFFFSSAPFFSLHHHLFLLPNPTHHPVSPSNLSLQGLFLLGRKLPLLYYLATLSPSLHCLWHRRKLLEISSNYIRSLHRFNLAFHWHFLLLVYCRCGPPDNLGSFFGRHRYVFGQLALSKSFLSSRLFHSPFLQEFSTTL